MAESLGVHPVDEKLVSTSKFCEKGFPREWIWVSWAFQLALLVQTPGIFFKKKNQNSPVPLPFLLYTLILLNVVHALNTRSSYTTLGGFFL
jgi:hypothetical protein